ncbi:MAG: glycosyltransferase family 2 protein [Actinomycetia bacterium]|nr:glycosyltransferase family 2 protein [Actinomycetes bacterium]
MTVSAIVVSYNTRELLGRCLERLAAGELEEVIVVDNGSSDGSRELVRERFPDARLLDPEVNLGFGAANNLGANVARGELLLFLNADTRPVADAVRSLAGFVSAREDVGIAGPRLLNPDGTLQRSVRGFPTVWRICTEYFFLRKLAPRSRVVNAFYGAGFEHDREREAEFVMGAVMCMRREVFDAVSGFDERYFLFSEEADLAYRVRHAGWRVVFTPTAEFVHVGGAATRPVWDQMYREQLRGHVLFLAAHAGLASAERARRWLVRALRFRGVLFPGPRGRLYLEAGRWLAARSVESLVQSSE